MYEVTDPDGGGMHENHVCFYADKTTADKFAAKQKNWQFNVRPIAARAIIVLESGEDPYEIAEQQKAENMARELREILAKIDPAIAASIVNKFK